MKNYDDFESWEVDYWLLEEKKYDELINFRKKRADEDKDDINGQLYLGEAYILAGEYKNAISLLKPIYEKYPEEHFGIGRMILDALKGLGKSENDFDWIIKPEIPVNAEEKLFQECVGIIQKGKVTISELSMKLSEIYGYTPSEYDEESLKGWLKKDDRIRFVGDDEKLFTYVTLK